LSRIAAEVDGTDALPTTARIFTEIRVLMKRTAAADVRDDRGGDDQRRVLSE
jgi:hypothetical protein